MPMESIRYAKARPKLDKLMEKVCKDHNPVIITRQNAAPVVMLSLADYRSYEETAHLMGSAKNAQRLNEAIAQLEAGAGKERELIE